MDTTLLAPVPHRQVVLTIPKRLRAYCLYRRRLLGEIARAAAGTITAAIRTLTGERDLAVGIVACLQTHGSRANWHPHLHLLVIDGGVRPDGTFVSWPAHDTARLTEAFRRAVLRLFVRRELFDDDQAAGMLAWPHSGFHVYTAVWVSEDDRAFAKRLARDCARNPVALERRAYDRAARQVTTTAPTRPRAPPLAPRPPTHWRGLEVLARGRTHIPDTGQVTTRDDGWYANRPRGMRRRAEPAPADAPVPIGTTPRLAPTDPSQRWAALRQQIVEVDPLACPHCAGPMRIVACLTPSAVIDQILTHLRTHAPSANRRSARSPPSTASRRPTASPAPRATPRSLHVAPRARLTPRGRAARDAVPPRSGATGDDPWRGRPDDPRRRQTGARLHPARTWARGTACSTAPDVHNPD